MSNPETGFMRTALRLVQEAPTLQSAQRSLSEAVALIDRRPQEVPSGRARGRSFFDRLMAEILQRVKIAVSRGTGGLRSRHPGQLA